MILRNLQLSCSTENMFIKRNHLKFRINFLIILFFLVGLNTLVFNQTIDSSKWVGTWSTAPYAADNNTPPAPYLANNTLRQVIRVSIGGDTLRVKFSNRTSSTPVTFNSVNIAVSMDSSSSIIDTNTITQLTFNDSESVTMDAYTEVMSDHFAFSLTPGMRLAITIYYGECRTAADMTFHYGSRTDSYILEGDQTTSADFAGSTPVERWYNLSTVEVLTSKDAASVAVLGNSITDGYGIHGGLYKWTDSFSDKLLSNSSTSNVSVLNLGIGATWLSTNGVGRFQQDVLEQSGLRWIIVFYGVNDIGGNASADVIISAYKNLIAQAHAQNIRIYGATITPFKGHSYYSESHEVVRNEVNEWIRTPGNFDKCIDFDKVIRDPQDTLKLKAEYSNDWLHPSVDGYYFLGQNVDVNLFLGSDTTFAQPVTESHYFEAECAEVGSDWDIFEESTASNNKYVTVKSGTESLDEASSTVESKIVIPFTIDSTSNYTIFARTDCPSYNDDSYWVSVDNGEFVMNNGLATNGWEWKSFGDFTFEKGEHKITICYREDGAKLDKICVTNSLFSPQGVGDEAENICSETDVKSSSIIPKEFKLEQNYPNPFNPTTEIRFSIATQGLYKLNVYNALGQKVSELLNANLSVGNYVKTFDASNLASGTYFYNLEGEGQNLSKKMVLLR